jgi:hypothetical protein
MADFAKELEDAVRTTRDVLADDRTWVRLGRLRCPEAVTTLDDPQPHPCSGQLWRDHNDPDHPAIACLTCGARWEREAWDLLGAVLDIAVSAKAAASFVGVSERTVRRWVTEGKLSNRGTDDRFLVRVADLATLGRVG